MDWQEQRDKSVAFAKKLNAGNFQPETSGGQVELAATDEDGQDRTFTDEELAETGYHHGYVDGHPEGADRGGYVPFVFTDETETVGAFWDGGACEWFCSR